VYIPHRGVIKNYGGCGYDHHPPSASKGGTHPRRAVDTRATTAENSCQSASNCAHVRSGLMRRATSHHSSWSYSSRRVTPCVLFGQAPVGRPIASSRARQPAGLRAVFRASRARPRC
jgi:hypothetical protein